MLPFFGSFLNPPLPDAVVPVPASPSNIYRIQQLEEDVTSLQNANSHLQQVNGEQQSSQSKLVEEWNHLVHNYNELKSSDSKHASELQRALHELELERSKSDQLLQQNIVYKSQIAASTGLEAQLTDSAIQRDFSCLAHNIQSWALETARSCKPTLHVSPAEVADSQFCRLPYYRDISAAKALDILVSMTLIDVYQPEYTFGFATKSMLGGANAIATESYRSCKTSQVAQWLRITNGLIATTAHQKLLAAKSDLVEQALQHLKASINATFVMQWSVETDEGVRSLLTTACNLFHLLHLHPSTFRIRMFSAVKGGMPRVFDPSTMEDITLEDDEALVNRPLKACISPLLYKISDDQGNKLKQAAIICKAKVLPLPAET